MTGIAADAKQQELPALLADILRDLESSLCTARNGPAKRLLLNRVSRLKLAIDQLDRARPTPLHIAHPQGNHRAAG